MLLLLADAADAPGVEILLVVVFGLAVYFVPTIIAWNKRQGSSVMIVNLVFGWTIVGWVGALAWALMNDPPAAVVIQQPSPPTSPSTAAPPQLCSTCGKYSLPDARFCSSCGRPFQIAANLNATPGVRPAGTA
jgi:hypothetical protein